MTIIFRFEFDKNRFVKLAAVAANLFRNILRDKRKVEILRNPARVAPYIGNHLIWPVVRTGRSFRIFIVEPSEYEPTRHKVIFSSTIRDMVQGETQLDDGFSLGQGSSTGADQFDLLTFPEAFLTLDVCLETLSTLPPITNFGCVHVGLRGSCDDRTHLIPWRELDGFVRALKKIDNIVAADLNEFESWLAGQSQHDHFNIGCVFTLDANGKKRICLHPKMIPATVELSPLSENYMKEGNILTAITLEPSDKRFQTITIQPLLCSDALRLDTDRGGRPMPGLTAHPECFVNHVPDHIDLVSVATCTPQLLKNSADGGTYLSWHRQFLDAFVLAATDDDYSRHHFATFVLSNFHTIYGAKPGGLSGAFLPTAVDGVTVPTNVVQMVYGKPNNGSEKRWSSPDDAASSATWEIYGHLNYLQSTNPDPLDAARVLGFTVQRFPRHCSPWRRPPNGLTNYKLKTAAFVEGFSALRFDS